MQVNRKTNLLNSFRGDLGRKERYIYGCISFRRNNLQRKSVWCISNGVEKVYGTVESLALYRYKSMGYPSGVHCEGAFPITLFGILFWDEIYNADVPGAFVSLYQDAPMDLFSSEFYENRRKRFDAKLGIVRKFDSETLSGFLKTEFESHCDFKSICQSNIFNDSDVLQVRRVSAKFTI